MQRKIIKNLIYAQVSFFLCLIVDVFITTKAFTSNRGLSFYGEHFKTIIPFALGFFLCDFFLLRAVKLLPSVEPSLGVFTMPLRVLALLLILIVLTPDNLSGLFNMLHEIASFCLFLFEFILSIWLVVRWHNTYLSWFLLLAQFLAGIMAGLSEFQFSQYLSESSLLYQLFFSSLLVLAISNIVRSAEPRAVEETISLDVD